MGILTNSRTLETAKQAEQALDAMPIPGGPDLARCRHTRDRLKMLRGTWLELARDHLVIQLGPERAQMHATPSVASNPFAQVCTEVSVLYDAPPTIMHKRAKEEEYRPLTELVSNAGYWAQAQEVQRYTVGLRECFVAIEIDDETGAFNFRTVTPDIVRATAGMKTDQPTRIEELRRYPVALLEGFKQANLPLCSDDQSFFWGVLVHDVSNQSAPSMSIHLLGNGTWAGTDITADIWRSIGSENPLPTGENYPYRFASRDGKPGRPFLPYVLYHAKKNGDRMFDPFYHVELVLGTLDIAVLYSFLLHIARDASWPQRYMINGMVPMSDVGKAVGNGETQPVQTIIPDPTMVLQIVQVPDSTATPTAGQWQPGGDIEKHEAVLSSLTVALAQSAGVSPSDVQRLGGTARSGAAISLTNAGKREQQRRLAPIFADPDARLLAYCAAMHNRWADSSQDRAGYARFPESGYEVLYKKVPRSPEELKSHREHILALLDARLISRVDAYAELNDTSRAAAETALRALEDAEGDNENEAMEVLDEVAAEIESLANELKPNNNGYDTQAIAESGTRIIDLIDQLRDMLKGEIEHELSEKDKMQADSEEDSGDDAVRE